LTHVGYIFRTFNNQRTICDIVKFIHAVCVKVAYDKLLIINEDMMMMMITSLLNACCRSA